MPPLLTVRGAFAWLAFAVVMAPGIGLAAKPVLSVAPLHGESGVACAASIVRYLQASYEVRRYAGDDTLAKAATFADVAASLARAGERIDADVLVMGSVSRGRLVLEAYALPNGRLLGLKRLKPGPGCRLGPKSRRSLLSWVAGFPAAKAAPSPPASPPAAVTQVSPPASSPPASSPPPPPEAPPSSPPPTSPPPPTPSGPSSPPPRAPPAEAIAPAPTSPDPVLGVELHLGIASRRLALEGASGDIRTLYEIGAMPTLGVAIEAYPLVGVGVPALAGFELVAAYRQALGVRSRPRDGGPTFSTRHQEAEVGLGYAVRFVAFGRRVAIHPEVGYHLYRFALSRDALSPAQLQLPNVAYESVRLGARGRVELSPRIVLTVRAAYLATLRGGAVFGPGYYEDGYARGVEIAGGFRYTLFDGLSAGLEGHYLGYGLSLGPDAAGSGGDRALGLRLGVRYAL